MSCHICIVALAELIVRKQSEIDITSKEPEEWKNIYTIKQQEVKYTETLMFFFFSHFLFFSEPKSYTRNPAYRRH